MGSISLQGANGFVGGGGIDCGLTQNIILGVEYDYYGFRPTDQLGVTAFNGFGPENFTSIKIRFRRSPATSTSCSISAGRQQAPPTERWYPLHTAALGREGIWLQASSRPRLFSTRQLPAVTFALAICLQPQKQNASQKALCYRSFAGSLCAPKKRLARWRT